VGPYSLIEDNKWFRDLTGFPEQHFNHFNKRCRGRIPFWSAFKVQARLYVLSVEKDPGYSIFLWK